jgi:hypothetical protein
MKQTFPMLNLGNQNLPIKELSVGEMLSIAKLDPNKLEQQLSSFLRYALGDDEAPYLMTIQQRYYCLLQYLSQQKTNDLAVSVNINNYLKDKSIDWKESISIGDLTVRQLNGYEIEALELIAESVDDWILGAMALQITYGDNFPYIVPLNDRKLAGNVIASRYEELLKLDQDSLNDLYSKYQEADSALASLLLTGFDSKGVVIYENAGGVSSEPARFQVDSSITGFTKQLFSALVEGSAKATAQREYESD